MKNQFLISMQRLFVKFFSREYPYLDFPIFEQLEYRVVQAEVLESEKYFC